MPSTRQEELVRKSKGNTATEETVQMEASEADMDLRQMIRQLNTTVTNEVQGLKRLINDQHVELRENLEEIRKSVDDSHSEIVELKETNKQQLRTPNQ